MEPATIALSDPNPFIAAFDGPGILPQARHSRALADLASRARFRPGISARERAKFCRTSSFVSRRIYYGEAEQNEKPDMSRTIDYGNLMHRAMRSLIQEVLTDVEQNGLPGEHHFFITFDTHHPDVEIADWLADRYPGEMTVVMQHWYDNLRVEKDGFAVTLNFGDSPEPLYIPYDAIKTFVDPSVEFGLRFETQQDSDNEEDVAEAEMAEEVEDIAPTKDAEIVSLDSFRK